MPLLYYSTTLFTYQFLIILYPYKFRFELPAQMKLKKANAGSFFDGAKRWVDEQFILVSLKAVQRKHDKACPTKINRRSSLYRRLRRFQQSHKHVLAMRI